MADLKLTTSGDLDLSTNDLQLVTGIEAIRQELQIRYRFFLGEWFLNTDEGVPYIQDLLKKNPSEARVRALMAEVALDTPGVEQIQNYTADLDAAERRLTIRIDLAARVDGVLVYEPFVVEVAL